MRKRRSSNPSPQILRKTSTRPLPMTPHANPPTTLKREGKTGLKRSLKCAVSSSTTALRIRSKRLTPPMKASTSTSLALNCLLFTNLLTRQYSPYHIGQNHHCLRVYKASQPRTPQAQCLWRRSLYFQ
jgi:hypothetical protein